MHLIQNSIFTWSVIYFVFICNSAARSDTIASVFLAGVPDKQLSISLSPGQTEEFENPTKFGFGPLQVDIDTSATVGISPDGWDIRLSTSADVSRNSSPDLLNATASVSLIRTGKMIGAGPYPDFLVLSGRFEGVVEVSPFFALHDGSMKVGSFQINVLEELFFIESGSINLPFQAVVPVASDGSYQVDMSLYSESWSRFGTTSGDFLHTLSLTSITLPSGALPEEAGWTLAFDDGVRSPNIGVPEPSTAAFLALSLATTLLLTRSRQSKLSVDWLEQCGATFRRTDLEVKNR